MSDFKDIGEVGVNTSENGSGKEKSQGIVELETKINKLFAAIETGEIKDGQVLEGGIVNEPVQKNLKGGVATVDQLVLSSGKKPEDRGINIRIIKLGGNKKYQVNIDDYRESERVGEESDGVQQVSGVKYSFTVGGGVLFGSDKNEVLTSVGHVSPSFDGPGIGGEFTDKDINKLNELFGSILTAT